MEWELLKTALVKESLSEAMTFEPSPGHQKMRCGVKFKAGRNEIAIFEEQEANVTKAK